MVSNFDRIFEEITKESKRLAPDDVDPEALVTLAMEIVAVEDEHRVQRIHNINQETENKILTTSVNLMKNKESD